MTRRFFLIVLGALAVLAGCSKSPTQAPSPQSAGAGGLSAEVVEINNRGVGLMGRFDYAAAVAAFTEALNKAPESLDIKVNLAIATLNRQNEGDEAAALRMLREALAKDAEHLRARYVAAILMQRSGQSGDSEEAARLFLAVAQADPADAYAAYRVGQTLRDQQRNEEALEWFKKALQREPYLRSACFNAFQLLMRLGREAEAAEMRELFDRMGTNPRSRLVEDKYTRMGPKAMASAFDLKPTYPPRPPGDGPVIKQMWSPGIASAPYFKWREFHDDERPSITACDIDQDGRIEVFLANVTQEERPNVLMSWTGRSFDPQVDHPLTTVRDVNAALWGDYDNDGLVDVYFCRRGPNQLWRQHPKGAWTDVTAATGVADGELDTIDGAMMDFDHDGDLDIFCVNSNGPNELLNNNLDGTFRPIAAQQGIAGAGRGSRQVLPADLDSDGDADIIVINAVPPHDVFINERLWSYRQAEGLEDFQRRDVAAAVAADADADGRVELYAISDGGSLAVWSRDDKGRWTSSSLGVAMKQPAPGRAGLAVLDVDGNGVPNIVMDQQSVLGDPGFVVLERQPHTGRTDMLFDGSNAGIVSWAPIIVYSGAGSPPSILGVRSGEQPVMTEAGGGGYEFARLTLSGKQEPGDPKPGQTMRSNASGLGAKVNVRIDSHWTALDTYRGFSGPGQSLQPLAVGMRGHAKIDFVSIDWPDGVLQSEIDLKAGQWHHITETQRQVSSCPVLFAWDGRKFEFVSDVLGVGGIGYMVAPGEYAPSRPWENFLLPEGLAQPRGGRYLMKLSEPMEEACYLDAAALVVHDLPPGWSMTLDERMNIAGPEPTGRALYFQSAVQPIRAVNDRGEDVTATIVQADLVAAPVGELDHRFIGRLAGEHALTLEFGRPLSEIGENLVLIADGWVEYPYSQTMFAAWQAGATYNAPTLEARGADGQWHMVHEQFGYPAGMPRQMSLPLGALPPGADALRLGTNQEIYWDRVIVAAAELCPEVRVTKLRVQQAGVAQTGFAHRTTGTQRQPHYDYAVRPPFWDTRYQEGFYTELGDATELVTQVDDALAIIGPGEEVHIEFDAAPLSTPQPGWTRRLVFECNGWCKDMDLFTQDGMTLAPLPSTGMDSVIRNGLHDRYNRRFHFGRGSASSHNR